MLRSSARRSQTAMRTRHCEPFPRNRSWSSSSAPRSNQRLWKGFWAVLVPRNLAKPAHCRVHNHLVLLLCVTAPLRAAFQPSAWLFWKCSSFNAYTPWPWALWQSKPRSVVEWLHCCHQSHLLRPPAGPWGAVPGGTGWAWERRAALRAFWGSTSLCVVTMERSLDISWTLFISSHGQDLESHKHVAILVAHTLEIFYLPHPPTPTYTHACSLPYSQCFSCSH